MQYLLLSYGEYSDYGLYGIYFRGDSITEDKLKELRRESIRIASDNDNKLNIEIDRILKEKGLSVENPRNYDDPVKNWQYRSQDYYETRDMIKSEMNLETDSDEIFIRLLENEGFKQIQYEEYNLDHILDE